MVSGPMSCVKCLLFFFNLLFVMSGIAVLTVGAISQHMHSSYDSFVDENLSLLPVILIATGALIFIIAFFGCCGALKENRCLLNTFAVLLLLMFVVEVGAGIAAYIHRSTIGTSINEKMLESIKLYDSNKNIKNDWDILQHDVKCCGVNGPSDWAKQNTQIPSTCCANMLSDEECSSSQAYSNGCWDTVQQLLYSNALLLGGVTLGVAFIQLLGLIFACCLARSILRDCETV